MPLISIDLRRVRFIRNFLCVLSVGIAAAADLPRLYAAEKDTAGWIETGDGIRKKRVAFVVVDVYEIRHFTKELPKERTKRAMVMLDADKKFIWKMLREVSADKIRETFLDSFKENGFLDETLAKKFCSAFARDIKEGARVTIEFAKSTKTTTIQVEHGGTASISGDAFMHAVWNVWFGKFDQPELGDALIRKL